MGKNKRVNRKFVEIYESKIKEYRREYYKNIINVTNTNVSKSIYIAFNLIPIIVAILILLFGNFSISSEITAIIVVTILNIVLRILSKVLNLDSTNNYLKEIMKYGYFSIEDYEKKIKKYITGPNGYYTYLLNDIMTKYNISDKTRKIPGAHGELYYIWTNANQDRLLMLNSRTTEKPEIISIRFVNIRYFRIDRETRQIVMKTDLEDYFFQLDALDTLNELIKEKRLENIQGFNPEEHINDFELYMHKVRGEVLEQEHKSKGDFSMVICQVIIYFIAIALIIFLKSVLTEYNFVFDILNILLLVILSLKIKDIAAPTKQKVLNEDDVIRVINTNPDCKRRFEELKFALGIHNNYDRIYSNEGACYLTWVANGYFHIFLNLIYFNVVYMSVKTQDVVYFNREGSECILKLKDKTLTFTKDAEAVFSKILPNKDYKWIKGFKN